MPGRGGTKGGAGGGGAGGPPKEAEISASKSASSHCGYTVGGQPTAQRPLGNAVLAGHADQRAAVLEVRPQYLPAGERLVALRRGQGG
jgi:hypothetical protein